MNINFEYFKTWFLSKPLFYLHLYVKIFGFFLLILIELVKTISLEIYIKYTYNTF
jgi:hypothetical protein